MYNFLYWLDRWVLIILQGAPPLAPNESHSQAVVLVITGTGRVQFVHGSQHLLPVHLQLLKQGLLLQTQWGGGGGVT